MTYLEMRELLKREPFEPIRIHLKDGRFYDIRDPKQNLLSELRMLVGKPDPEDPSIGKIYGWIYWGDIARVETLSAAISA